MGARHLRPYLRPMTTTPTPDRPLNVVIAGAGVAGIEALIALHDIAAARVNVMLLSPDHDFVFRPLSVGEPFALGDIQRVPVAQIAADFGAQVCRDGLARVDSKAHTVTTTAGTKFGYDRLIVAIGARRVPAYEHVITFRGQEDAETLHGLVRDIEDGYSKTIAFVVPPGVAWSLPVYELALMTAQRAFEMSEEVEIHLVTPEEYPLSVFGPQAGSAVQQLLDDAGIHLHCRANADVPGKGTIVMRPGKEELHCDRIVSLASIEGLRVEGLPSDGFGFIPIDNFSRVGGVTDVYAVGDGTNFPLKQGGIACQQADVAAFQIARAVGVPADAEPFRPVLRGKLLTGGAARFMRHDITGLTGNPDETGTHNLWWPPTKVAGRYLAPYLETQAAEGAQSVDLGSVPFATR